MLRKTASVLVLAGALVTPALADTITLKSGHEVSGKLIEETGDYVLFQVPGGRMKIMKKDIATYSEDQDYGQRYISQGKRDTAAESTSRERAPSSSCKISGRRPARRSTARRSARRTRRGEQVRCSRSDRPRSSSRIRPPRR